jgi:hypothetical protein
MTGLNNIRRVDKVLSNGTPRYEAGLVLMDKEGDKRSEPEGEAFRVDFKTTVLEGDWAKVIRPISTRFLWEKDDVRLVDGSQVRRESMEVIESLKEIGFNEFPILLEKSGSETIRTRAGVVVHGEEGISNLSQRERLDEGVRLRRVE